MTEPEFPLTQIYDAFNRRDIEAVLATMTPDVEWPNAMDNVRIQGHEAVRAYWTHQFSVINPHVEPVAFETRPDGKIAVTVDQTIKDLAGNLLIDNTVLHVYTLKEGKVQRMDIEPGAPGAPSTTRPEDRDVSV